VPPSIADEYRSRLAARRATCSAFDVVDARFAYARLAAFGTFVLLAVLAWRGSVSPWLLLLPVVTFVWLALRHDRLRRTRDRAARAIQIYEHGLARVEDRWNGMGEPGDRFRDDSHVYANDLDLFGTNSLFALLSLARTRSGEAALARWLIQPADAAEIRARQEAVAELAPALDVREEMATAGADVRAQVHTDRLLAWAEQPMPSSRALRLSTWIFSATTLAGIALVALTGVWQPLGVFLLLQTVVFRQFRDQIDNIVSARDRDAQADFVADALTHRAMDLAVVADLLQLLERQTFRSGRLAALHGTLHGDGVPASRIIGRLHRMAVVHDSERNTMALPLGLFLLGYLEVSLALAALIQLVRPHVAVAVDGWRRRHGGQVRVWIESVAELEALMSLAGYRCEHADDPFPEIATTEGGGASPAIFEGTGLGHPLLPAAAMVRNDVKLNQGTQLLVVSGSNMSGKSTLLRTVGINAVLAMMGAPVRAGSLRLSPLAIGATLRIQDSLQEGRSRFYAEITRIREIADLAAGDVPLLFLLDELFHGTNSHDRLVGASGVLESLLARGAIGLVTTHDLALTAVADRLAPRAVNVHFEDWFAGDQMQFDYRMKPGPVTRSNALALMRAVGLALPDDA
jgi:MutS-like protein